jgi:parallel beta-helix repeat protein
LPTVPNDAVLVTSFGARPDDDAPDDAAISAALQSLKPNPWLVFPPGRYLQAKTIRVDTEGVVLWGPGATIHATNPDDQAIWLGADRTGIYGFTLTAATKGRGSKPNQSRIVVYRDWGQPGYVTGATVRGNVVREGTGADLSNSSTSAGILVYKAADFTVAENTVRRSLADGIHITGGSHDGRVIGNTVRETGDDMIAAVSYLGNGWEERMRTDPQWRDSALAWRGAVSNVVIEANDVASAYWGRGISVVGGRNISIKGNTIRNSTWGAGVFVGQEGGYATYGVRNVLVQGNLIEAVQTRRPPYLPEGTEFLALKGRLATGATTMHGGVEVHAIQDADDTVNTPALADLIAVRDVRVEGNRITETKGDGMRVGISTPAALLARISMIGNDLHRVQGKPIRVLSAVGGLQCEGNTADGTSATDSACLTAPAVSRVEGASLDCSRFR